MYLWIKDEVFLPDTQIECLEKLSGGYAVKYADSVRHVSFKEGERIIALLQRDSVGMTLKIGQGQTINPQDISKATLYGEGEEYQVVVLKTKRGGTIEVGTAFDLVGYEIVHNYFLKDRPPFSASDWANNQVADGKEEVEKREEVIREFWKALYDATDTAQVDKHHPLLIKYFSYGDPV